MVSQIAERLGGCPFSVKAAHHDARAPRILHCSAAPKILVLFYRRKKPVSQGDLSIVLLVFSLWEYLKNALWLRGYSKDFRWNKCHCGAFDL